MGEAGAREALIEAGRRLDELRLIIAAEGNLSVRLGGDLFLCTPAGAPKGSLRTSDLVVVDLEGVSRGGRRTPSSEWRLHAEVYRSRPEIAAVCHAHPPHALAFACARRPLPVLMPEAVAVLGGSVPVAPYAPPGGEEVAASVRPLLPQHDALLLANHGALTLGLDTSQALARMEVLERVAQVALAAEPLGGGVPLTAAEIRELGG